MPFIIHLDYKRKRMEIYETLHRLFYEWYFWFRLITLEMKDFSRINGRSWHFFSYLNDDLVSTSRQICIFSLCEKFEFGWTWLFWTHYCRLPPSSIYTHGAGGLLKSHMYFLNSSNLLKFLQWNFEEFCDSPNYYKYYYYYYGIKSSFQNDLIP